MAAKKNLDEGWHIKIIHFLEKYSFLVLLILQSFFFAFLIQSHRIPIYHDGFHYFSLQYFFLNNAYIYREVPQWIPFMTHGTSATWWYSVQGVCGIVPNIFLQFAQFISQNNFIIIYYLGMFVDELLLIVGAWLLAKQLFKSDLTAFFVCISVAGSSIWATQPYFNFYHYYAIPLIIYFIHRFFSEGKWCYLFFAANLFALQVIGNALYVVPIVSMVVTAYFLLYGLYHKELVFKQFQSLRFDWRFFLFLILAMVSLVMIGLMIKQGMDAQTINYNTGRAIDGSVPLDVYLNYNKSPGWEWKELVLRFSPGMDATLYLGLLAFPLIVIGFVFNNTPQFRNILFLVIFLFFITVGSVVSIVLFYAWPLMKFYRHLALLAPIIKLFLCFLAGYGFEYLLKNEEVSKKLRGVFIIISIGLILVSIYLFSLYQHPLMIKDAFRSIDKAGLLAFVQPLKHINILKDQVCVSSTYAFVLGLLFFLFGFLRQVNLKTIFLVTLLLFHICDLYDYKVSEYLNRTMALTKSEQKMCYFREMPYMARRDVSPQDVNERLDLAYHTLIPRSSYYWALNAFTFYDPMETHLITYTWQDSFGRMMKAFNKESILDVKAPPKDYIERVLHFPKANPAARKIAGVDEDKIQFFNTAHFYSELQIAALIPKSGFTGNTLLLSLPESAQGPILINDLENPSLNEKLYLPYQILRYSANEVDVQVEVSSESPIWMSYSDVWHPSWKVKVNGREEKVYKADLAYKAVQLNKGINTVQFKFQDSKTKWLQTYFGWNSLFWVLGLFLLAFKICLKRI